MFEILFIVALSYLYLERRARKARESREGRKVRGLDAELKKVIEDDGDKTGIAFEIKQYLLAIVAEDQRGDEKFSDARIDQAERILDRAGASALYWMSDIAAQLAILSAAKMNGVATSVDAKVGPDATAENIVKAVVSG